MEGDDNVRIIFAMLRNFNPLPPYGGRPKLLYKHIEDFHFNPLPPYGGRLAAVTTARFTLDISIHSLRMEGDHSSGKRQVQFPISIHSLRMEGDHRNACLILRKLHFNPLPPYGGRLEQPQALRGVLVFQSTPSVWRETSGTLHSATYREDFNPLPPYGGRLQEFLLSYSQYCHFNPLPPYGGRR